jgi:hypothetical protein
VQLVSDYYKEKVLSLDKKARILRELPRSRKSLFLDGAADISIDHDFFCWKLKIGKAYIECRSEEEAKYLEVFLRAGRNEVFVPADENYLKEILPQLLYLKKRHDEVIEDRIDGLIYPRMMERGRQHIWRRIFRDIEDLESALIEETYEEVTDA